MVAPVVDVAWLDARSAPGRHPHPLVIADVRWALGGPPGRESFEAGHIPGAVFVDLDDQLAAPATAVDGRHPLPSAEAFATAMSSLGIGDDTTVVAYDDARGSSAARLVWMLRILGRDAALLDGGLAAWTQAHGAAALHTGPVTPERRRFSVAPWPTDRILDADAVATLDPSLAPLLDARDHGRFTGERATAADPRPGHVPGAVSAPWAANLGDDGRMLDVAALRTHYAALGVDVGEGRVSGGPDRSDGNDLEADATRGRETSQVPPVVYCGSGVTASLDLLALELIGVDDARLYPGSWSQWAADPTRPVALGDHPQQRA